MSCNIRPIGLMNDVPLIRKHLFPDDEKQGTDNWLQICQLSLSPTGDVLAIGNGHYLVILSSKYDGDFQIIYNITYRNKIHKYDNIAAMLCLPIVELSRSGNAAVAPEWTCLAVAFDSGIVRFYTEDCDLLFEEQFHNENISKMKCQSHHRSQSKIVPELNLEEIHIQYASVVCIINGQQLFGNLRKLRNKLISVKGYTSENDDDIKLVPLKVKKLYFHEQDKTNDVTVLGVSSVNSFDHLVTAAMVGGFDAKYRRIPPKSTLALIAGSQPYLGFHYVLEGVNQPGVSYVAKAVANRLRNVLPGWLSSSSSNNQPNADDSNLNLSIDDVTLRFGLVDQKRTGIDIILTPCHRLAAVSDALARVALIDCHHGIVIRLLKGYRQAQCAFLKVPDESKSKYSPGNKLATFLIIYSPKKATIEFFTVQQGKKIAAFSASKYSRLLYVSYGLMGAQQSTSNSHNNCHFTCVFIDNDGRIKNFEIPFFFALGQISSVPAKDIHLYKKLIQHIKNDEFDIENERECLNICSEITTLEIKKQTINMLSKTRNTMPMHLIVQIIDIFLRNTDNTVDSFVTLCENLKSVLNLFLYVTECKLNEAIVKQNNQTKNESEVMIAKKDEQFEVDEFDRDENIKNPEKESNLVRDCGKEQKESLESIEIDNLTDPQEKELIEGDGSVRSIENDKEIIKNENRDEKKRADNEDVTEQVTKNETTGEKDTIMINNDEIPLSDLNPQSLDQLRQLVQLGMQNKVNNAEKIRVTFCESTQFNLTEFLSGFDLSKAENISLKENIDPDKTNRIAEMLFGKYISGKSINYNNLNYAISKSRISINDLFDLLIHLWLDKPLIVTETIEETTIQYLLRLICILVASATKDTSSLYQQQDISISPFWKRIREKLADSSKPFSAYIIAVLFKHVSESYEIFCYDENIEILSYECIQWNLLVGKLEEISVLDIILSNRRQYKSSTLPMVPFNNPPLSLNYIISAGTGSVTELVARWLISYGIDPKRIIDDDVLCQNEKPAEVTKEKNLKHDDLILHNLCILKKRFPYSLNGNRLLANMCWQYALAWDNDITCLDNLNAALMCLNNITDNIIKKGLIVLVWDKNMKIVVENITKLVNKVGKLPKEILCQQNTGLNVFQIKNFVATCTAYFDSFLDIALYTQQDVPSIDLSYEDIWDSLNNTPSLIELAVQFNEINLRLIQLHYIILLVLEMITRFSIKHCNPVTSLLEPSVASLLFTDFKSKIEIDWEKTDIKIEENRVAFLHKIIASTFDTITTNNDRTVYCSEHMDWVDKCLILAQMWNMDIESLKIFQIYQLYVHGYDLIAQDLISALGSDSSNILGEKLVEVAGKRLRLFLSNAPNINQNIAAFDPTITNYINLLNDEWCSASTLEDIQSLSIQILLCLKRNNSKYELVELFLQACENLLQVNR